ncbi:hypothetical protein [Deinococcus multiflagellatus]|uniref:Right handed beta helix domain-containing protein n=1 Tax=Deinococcus multiflagellatus TaxID=1656887 RepID=A0ABW1ZS53_9DEIO|nr:hypothetical protein [Deinococcus multiflagellatus]MBZ9713561.1 hypothetical protein [Deinococcus multiflagellatus]
MSVPHRFSPARTPAVTLLGAALLALSACGQNPSPAADQPRLSAQAAQVYRVSCTATSGPRTLEDIGRLALNPGDQVLLQRGCTFPATASSALQVSRSGTSAAPITFGAYGTGAAPVIRQSGQNSTVQIRGSWLVFQDIALVADPLPAAGGGVRCTAQPVGWLVGWEVWGTRNTLNRVSARGYMTGVMLVRGDGTLGSHRVLNSSFFNNSVMQTNTPGGDDDSGAWGVLVNSSNNEIASNRFTGHSACSEDYGRDGASVEIYQSSNNWVHHNETHEDVAFVELGGTPALPSRNNRIEDNVYMPVQTGGAFVTLRGARSSWGANPGTSVRRNTSYLADLGITCSDGCSAQILVAEDNKLWERQTSSGLSTKTFAFWADAPVSERRNTFWRDDGRPVASIDGGSLDSTDRIAPFTRPTATF